jgi:transposase-like protein
MPAGRPTSYRPEYCEAVVEYGRKGKSLAWMAAQFDVNKDTIHEWIKVHPEFSDAMARARVHSQAWWEDFGQDNTMLPPGAGTFNAAAWGKSISARFSDDWREKSEIKHEGGLTIHVTPTENDL